MQPHAVLHPHNALWLTLPLRLPLLSSRLSQKVIFAHVDALPDHTGSSNVSFGAISQPGLWLYARRQIPKDSREHCRAYGPLNGGPDSRGTGAKGHPKQCASLMVACLFRPTFSHRRLGARVGHECAEGGVGSRRMQRILSPPTPMETSYIKLSELASKWKTERSKQQSPPPPICFTMCYTIWACQWDKNWGRPNRVEGDIPLTTTNWQFVKFCIADKSRNHIRFQFSMKERMCQHL